MSDQCGLTTEEALLRLRRNINEEMDGFARLRHKTWHVFVGDMLRSVYVPLTTIGVLQLFVEMFLFFVVLVTSINIRQVVLDVSHYSLGTVAKLWLILKRLIFRQCLV